MIAIVTVAMDFSGMRSQKVAQSFIRVQGITRIFGAGLLSRRKGSSGAVNILESASLLPQTAVIGSILFGSGIKTRRLGGSNNTWKVALSYPYYGGLKNSNKKGSTQAANTIDGTNFVSQTLDLSLTSFAGLKDSNPKGSSQAISVFDVTPLLQQTLVTVGTLSFTGMQPNNKVAKTNNLFNATIGIPKFVGMTVKRLGTTPNMNLPLYSTQDVYLQTNTIRTNQIQFTSLNYFGSPQQPQMIQFWS